MPFPDENTEASGSIPSQLQVTLQYSGPQDSPTSLCLQRLAAVQQALNSHRISFILRGGLRILVDLRDTDTGDRPVLGLGQGGCEPKPVDAESDCRTHQSLYLAASNPLAGASLARCTSSYTFSPGPYHLGMVCMEAATATTRNLPIHLKPV